MVKIRLMRMGKKKQPYFRVVVADARSPRDGRFIENIGKYHPRSHPSVIEIDEDRALHWLSQGAQPSDPVRVLLQKTGIWSKHTGEAAPPPYVPEPEGASDAAAAARSDAAGNGEGPTADAAPNEPSGEGAAADAGPQEAKGDGAAADAGPDEAKSTSPEETEPQASERGAAESEPASAEPEEGKETP